MVVGGLLELGDLLHLGDLVPPTIHSFLFLLLQLTLVNGQVMITNAERTKSWLLVPLWDGGADEKGLVISPGAPEDIMLLDLLKSVFIQEDGTVSTASRKAMCDVHMARLCRLMSDPPVMHMSIHSSWPGKPNSMVKPNSMLQ